MDCFGSGPKPGDCTRPEFAPLLQCVCAADKCAQNCAAACADSKNPPQDSGIVDAPKESSWDGGYHLCSTSEECLSLSAQCVDPLGALGYAVCANCVHLGEPANCPPGQICIDYICQ
jgi:hypothetical protein